MPDSHDDVLRNTISTIFIIHRIANGVHSSRSGIGRQAVIRGVLDPGCIIEYFDLVDSEGIVSKHLLMFWCRL